MSPRTAFTIIILSAAAVVVAVELAAVFDGDPETPSLTELIATYVPAPVTFLAIAALVLWLSVHFLMAYRKRRRRSTVSSGTFGGQTMIESKVKWATVGAILAGIVVAILNAVLGNPSLLAPLPPWLAALIVAVAPGLVAFLAGYQAPHTDRSPTG